VIPGEVELDITVRSVDDDVRQQLLDEIEQALSIARALGGDYQINIHHGYPALYNDPTVTGWVKETAVSLLGAENVQEAGLVMGAEDFGYLAQASRGMMMSLGTKAPDGPPRFLHHPEFDIDENALPVGAAIMAETALRFVKGMYK
jgi:amidohydrolase